MHRRPLRTSKRRLTARRAKITELYNTAHQGAQRAADKEGRRKTGPHGCRRNVSRRVLPLGPWE